MARYRIWNGWRNRYLQTRADVDPNRIGCSGCQAAAPGDLCLTTCVKAPHPCYIVVEACCWPAWPAGRRQSFPNFAEGLNIAVL
jgi:hypothetical protein